MTRMGMSIPVPKDSVTEALRGVADGLESGDVTIVGAMFRAGEVRDEYAGHLWDLVLQDGEYQYRVTCNKKPVTQMEYLQKQMQGVGGLGSLTGKQP